MTNKNDPYSLENLETIDRNRGASYTNDPNGPAHTSQRNINDDSKSIHRNRTAQQEHFLSVLRSQVADISAQWAADVSRGTECVESLEDELLDIRLQREDAVGKASRAADHVIDIETRLEDVIEENEGAVERSHGYNGGKGDEYSGGNGGYGHASNDAGLMVRGIVDPLNLSRAQRDLRACHKRAVALQEAEAEKERGNDVFFVIAAGLKSLRESLVAELRRLIVEMETAIDESNDPRNDPHYVDNADDATFQPKFVSQVDLERKAMEKARAIEKRWRVAYFGTIWMAAGNSKGRVNDTAIPRVEFVKAPSANASGGGNGSNSGNNNGGGGGDSFKGNKVTLRPSVSMLAPSHILAGDPTSSSSSSHGQKSARGPMITARSAITRSEDSDITSAISREMSRPRVARAMGTLGARKVKKEPSGRMTIAGQVVELCIVHNRLNARVPGGVIPFVDFVEQLAKEKTANPNANASSSSSRKKYLQGSHTSKSLGLGQTAYLASSSSGSQIGPVSTISDLDAAVRETCMRPGIVDLLDLLPPVERAPQPVKEGNAEMGATYIFGTRRLAVVMRSDEPYVCTGGGVTRLEEHLARVLPGEAAKMEHRDEMFFFEGQAAQAHPRY